MIYSCAVPYDDVNIEADGCFDALTAVENSQTDVKYLGSGAFGLVIGIHGTIPDLVTENTYIAIKYGLGMEKDVVEGCVVSEYVDSSSLFVKTYGWTKCKTMPESWLPTKEQIIESGSKGLQKYLGYLKRGEIPPPKKKKRSKSNSLDFIFQEYAGISMGSALDKINGVGYRLNLYDARCIAFTFLHGLLIAREKSGAFSHNDIHTGNLTILYSESPVERIYERFGIKTNSRFQVKLIDLGESFSTPNPGNEKCEDIDAFFETRYWSYPGESIYKNLEDMGEKEKWVKFATKMREGPKMHANDESISWHFANNTKALIEILLTDPFFNPLRYETENITGTIKCSMCEYALTKHKCNLCHTKLCGSCFNGHFLTSIH